MLLINVTAKNVSRKNKQKRNIIYRISTILKSIFEYM